MGTALRACLAFGLRDVALIRPCVDAFDPHAVRASMGALFHMNVSTYDHFDDYRARYPGHALYPFMLDGATEIGRSREKRARRALRWCSETRRPTSRKLLRRWVSPCSSLGAGSGSLNLSVAVALGAYAFTRP